MIQNIERSWVMEIWEHFILFLQVIVSPKLFQSKKLKKELLEYHPKWRSYIFKSLCSVKFKSFCTTKETISKMKRQPMDWKKLFANDVNVTDKGLTSQTYKQLIQFNNNNNNKIQTTQSKNGQKIQLDISPKKTYRWPKGTRKDAHHR